MCISMTSTKAQLWFLITAAGWLIVGARIPPGYILQVTPQCDNISNNAVVNIVTDLDIAAKAKCKNGIHYFIDRDEVNFFLKVVSMDSSHSSETCIMEEIAEKVYTITVLVSWGEKGSPIHSHEEEYQVTCSFRDQGVYNTSNKIIDSSLIAAKAIQSYASNSTPQINVSLNVINVLGEIISAQSIHLGRKIQLKGKTDSEDIGLHAVGCDAVGGEVRYAIIRAGCGDGLVFDKREGFTSTGNAVFSPYFEAFKFPGAKHISFECNFTTCTTPCTGGCRRNSKRDTGEDEETFYIWMQSEPIKITDDDDETEMALPMWNSRVDNVVADVEPSKLDHRLWAAVGFITVLAVVSVVMSVCALFNTDCRRRVDLQYKV